jgi:amidase
MGTGRPEAIGSGMARRRLLIAAAICLAILSAGLVGVGRAAAQSPTSMTIEQAHAALADGHLTAVELTRSFLRRIHRHEPAYNAYTAMNGEALAEARASDARRRAGRARGILDGIPVAIKDSIDVAGLPTTGGWLSAQAGAFNLVPTWDAPVVARLRRRGAIILGKTNLPAFSGSGTNANSSWAGPTFNALNRHWAPGGSSTGSATAVAADLATVAIGEETGGSIQNPAAAQGLVGVKPTFGLVANTGSQPGAVSTKDVLGPIAKTAADAADVMDTVAGYGVADPKTTAAIGNVPARGYRAGLSTRSLKGATLGLYGPGWRHGDSLSRGTVREYRRAIGAVEALGATTDPDPFAGSGFAAIGDRSSGFDRRGNESFPYDMSNYLRNLGRRSQVHSVKEMSQALGVSLFGPGGPMHPLVVGSPQAEWSARHLNRPPDVSRFLAARERYLRVFDRVMDRHHLDALVFPQSAKPIGNLFGGPHSEIEATTVPEINIAGLPAVVVPAGRYPDGKPFSLEFVGRTWTEPLLLSYAYAFEQASPAPQR